MKIAVYAWVAALALVAPFAAQAAPNPGTAELGLMQGFPPPPDKRVLPDNFIWPPQNRWSFQHLREVQPTREIWRGDGPVSVLPTHTQELGGVSGTVREGRVMSIDQLLDESHTDAFVVVHRGNIVFERYMNGMAPHVQHQMFSATKSLVGTIMLTLIEEGRVDPARPVAEYVPELEGSAFGDATVQQVLDMTTGISFSEIYTDPDSDIWRYGHVFRLFGEPPAAYTGPRTIYDYLPTLKKEGIHGAAFHYVTPNTEALAWIIRRVTNKSVDANIQDRIWQPMGAERDGYIWLDREGSEMAGGGLNITARDAARFGWMILNGGRVGERQVVSEAIAKRILTPGDPAAFTAYYGQFRGQFPGAEWYGTVTHSYHDQWWSFTNGAVSAIGVNGQFIYLDPKAQMVVVKLSSSPDTAGGANWSNDWDGPLLYQALAEHLMKTR
jgi:CubicO group peptidase (beta-lactamase class C family)